MSHRWTVAELLGRGVALDAAEAVAVVQQLIDSPGEPEALTPPFGPPTIDNVEIGDDGSVRCRQCDVKPAVSEVGALLDVMLPRETTVRVPGALRYAVARALHEVDAPPFDSLEAFIAALARYAPSNPRSVVRQLAARVQPAITTPTAAPHIARPPVAPVALPLTPIKPGQTSTVRAPRFLIGAAAAAVSFSASYVGVVHYRIQREPALRAAAASNDRPVSALRPIGDSRRTGTSGELPEPRRKDKDVSPRAISSAEPSIGAPSASLPDDDGSAASPVFASTGTAVFGDTARTADARGAVAETPLDGDVAVMTIRDDGAGNYHVQPSPDGARIAFDSDRDGERGVYVAARDGSNVHRVSGPGYAAVPSWSPDGQQLAFIRGEPDRPRVWNLWLTRLSTSETRRLTNFSRGQTWNASWFPDGASVAYTHDDTLAIQRLGDGTSRTFASPVPGRSLRTPAVSPDGRHILFQVWGNGAWLLDLADGSMRCVLTDPTAEQFAWSLDGRRVAYHSRREGSWGVWIMAPPEV